MEEKDAENEDDEWFDIEELKRKLGEEDIMTEFVETIHNDKEEIWYDIYNTVSSKMDNIDE